ncbi:cytochrome P450 307a1-like [Palaemon carinicauda]|uniref:cytochrome P450 307a1-like n=1 Tax=Palaemon carinicauda TaxID=392227 RepID=UPI0035B64EDB
MAFALALAPATLVLIVIVVVGAALQAATQERKKRKQKQQQQQCVQRRVSTTKVRGGDDLEIARPTTAPGPFPLPFLGNIHNMAKYAECPYEGFSALGRKYGNVYKLYIGGSPAIVVGSYDGLKEVLVTKGNLFDARPNFIRFREYFGGNRDHSLALCDYSDLHKKRISLVRNYLTFRGTESTFLERFEDNIISEMPTLTDRIDEKLNKPMKTKELLSYCAMNIFSGYMCSKKFDYNNKSFQKCVRDFDFIFEDINNGHVTDSLPWLAPLFSSYFNTIKGVTTDIRDFILESVFNEKYRLFQEDPTNVSDLVDACFAILHRDDKDEKWDWDTILYIVEDLLGGSSAISNIIMRFLGFVLVNPGTMEKLHEEIDDVIGRNQTPTLSDRSNMNYSRAVLYEVLRMTSSPIVPHVASEDATIGGYYVEQGTTIILNNYDMNMNPDLWDEPLKFKPERFIVDGELKKPAHFIPFSTGKRSCVGYKVVMDITYFVTTTLLQKYDIRLPEGVTPDLPKGKISLSWESFEMIFSQRK